MALRIVDQDYTPPRTKKKRVPRTDKLLAEIQELKNQLEREQERADQLSDRLDSAVQDERDAIGYDLNPLIQRATELEASLYGVWATLHPDVKELIQELSNLEEL